MDENAHLSKKLLALYAFVKKNYCPEQTKKDAVKAVFGFSVRNFRSAVRTETGAETRKKHLQTALAWVLEKQGDQLEYHEITGTWRVLPKSQPAAAAVVRDKIDFLEFMEKHVAPGETVRVIGTWPASIAGDDAEAVAARTALERLIGLSASVRMLLPAPDSHFFIKNLYQHYGDSTSGSFKHKKDDSDDCIKLLVQMRATKPEVAQKFELKLFDGNPGLRLFATDRQIFVNHLLDHLRPNAAFTTVYDRKSCPQAEELIAHFDSLWAKAASPQPRPMPFNLFQIGQSAGIYRMFTYGHKYADKKKIPATVASAFEIKADGSVRHWIESKNKIHEARGWARKVGGNLFIETRDSAQPKLTAFLILRTIEDLQPGDLVFGDALTPSRKTSLPTAVRAILQKQNDWTQLEDLDIGKLELEKADDDGFVPPEIRDFLAGAHRNRLGFHQDGLHDLENLADEKDDEADKLGLIMFECALFRKWKMEEAPANQRQKLKKEIVIMLRHALTNGFRDKARFDLEFPGWPNDAPDELAIYFRI